ncbi:hypothetical protein ABW21_db0200547 [Orbilia brochopaga]|nr:hypothetical protein ABW21_db0200547 [Drechslerella brochopaga]
MCEADSPIAASDILDFKNLILPQGQSTLPLTDLGGTTFENFQVTKLSDTTIAGSFLSGFPGLAFLGAPSAQQSPTVAIIDPAHARHGGHITVPAGKRLESVDFFCCSTAAGESILEGKPCKQKACTVTLNGMDHNGQKVKEIAKKSELLDASAGGPATVVQPATLVAESAAGTAVSIASFTIGFTDITGGMRRRRNYAGRMVPRQMGTIDTLINIIVVGLVFDPLEGF